MVFCSVSCGLLCGLCSLADLLPRPVAIMEKMVQSNDIVHFVVTD